MGDNGTKIVVRCPIASEKEPATVNKDENWEASMLTFGGGDVEVQAVQIRHGRDDSRLLKRLLNEAELYVASERGSDDSWTVMPCYRSGRRYSTMPTQMAYPNSLASMGPS